MPQSNLGSWRISVKKKYDGTFEYINEVYSISYWEWQKISCIPSLHTILNFMAAKPKLQDEVWIFVSQVCCNDAGVNNKYDTTLITGDYKHNLHHRYSSTFKTNFVATCAEDHRVIAKQHSARSLIAFLGCPAFANILEERNQRPAGGILETQQHGWQQLIANKQQLATTKGKLVCMRNCHV